MAQNIGTNVTIDENDLYPFYESILDQIERIQDNHGLSKDRKNLKALLDHVGAGHKLVQNQFYGNEATQIKEELDKRNIPYIMLPSKLGNEQIETVIVRDSDKGQFEDVQYLIQRQNGRLSTELNVDQIIKDIKNEPTFKGMRTPVFEFADGAKRGLFLKELAKNNIPYSFDKQSKKVIIYPTSVYRKGEPDLSSAVLDMSVKYAMFDKYPDYSKFQQTVVKGNNETLQDFIGRYMGNHSGKLENMTETKALDIVEGKSGNALIVYKDISDPVHPYVHTIDIPEGSTKEEIFLTLSPYAEEIIRTEEEPIITPDASDVKRITFYNTEQLAKMDADGKLNAAQKTYLAKYERLGSGEKNPYYLSDVDKAAREESQLLNNLRTVKIKAGEQVVNSTVSLDRKCKAELDYIRDYLTQDSCGIKKEDAQVIAENLDASIKNGSGAFGWNYVDANKLEVELGRDGGTFDKDYNSERNIDIERDPVEVEIEAADE